METDFSYYIKLLKDIQGDASPSTLKYISQRFNRVAGIIKRRVYLLSNNKVIEELCKTREKIFAMRYLATASIKIGGIILFFLTFLGVVILYFSQSPGLLSLIIKPPDIFHYIVDKIVLTIIAMYIILGGSFNLLKYIIGLIFGIKFDGFYLGDYGQICLKKNCLRYYKAGKKRVYFYLCSALLPFLILGFTCLWLCIDVGNYWGIATLVIHTIMTILLYRKKKGELYRFVREIRVLKEQKYLSQILKLRQ